MTGRELMILVLGILLGIIGTTIYHFIRGFFVWREKQEFMEEMMSEIERQDVPLFQLKNVDGKWVISERKKENEDE